MDARQSYAASTRSKTYAFIEANRYFATDPAGRSQNAGADDVDGADADAGGADVDGADADPANVDGADADSADADGADADGADVENFRSAFRISRYRFRSAAVAFGGVFLDEMNRKFQALEIEAKCGTYKVPGTVFLAGAPLEDLESAAVRRNPLI